MSVLVTHVRYRRTDCIALAIAVSASFSTPISYQTNLIVYGPGGYKFNDFIKAML